MTLTREEVERFRAVVLRRFGLNYEDDKIEFLTDVLQRRVAATGARVDNYVNQLDTMANRADELRTLAEQLTVNETFFFRNMDNFRAFAERVLPERMRGERRLRILSAGCASGEEPYTLAMMVRETIPDLPSWDVKITGVDLSPPMLAKAARGRYTAWSLRATSDEMRARYFRNDGREFVVVPEVKQMVTFEERNLLDQNTWPEATYDVIFCRNVIMYFTPEIMRQIVKRASAALLPGGFFFLGHAETLRGLSQEFHLCHTHEAFYYQKRDDAPARDDIVYPLEQIATAQTLPEPSTSWVDAIQQASERIAKLASAKHETAPAATQPVTSQRSWDLGLVLEAMRQERFSDALELLSTLPAESLRDPDTLLLRAILLTNSGQLAEAESACANILMLDDLNAGAHYVKALCREHAGDAAGAIEHDKIAAYLDVSFAMPHLHIGLVSKRRGDEATSRHELSQALLLLAREDISRLLLFGGGFSREALLTLCRNELRAVGGDA